MHKFLIGCTTGDFEMVLHNARDECNINKGLEYACKGGYSKIVKYLIKRTMHAKLN